MKESHTVNTADYAVDNEIDHEPSLNWWVKVVLEKRLRIIYLAKKSNT